MQKQKGFTIIELIVVVAIIGVLAVIVTTNVVGYINKTKDASIKADLGAIHKNAVLFFVGNNTYVGFLTDTGFTGPATAITKVAGVAPIQASSANAYCTSSKLASDDTKSWCVDSNGFNGLANCTSGSQPACTTETLGLECSSNDDCNGSYCFPGGEWGYCGYYGAECNEDDQCAESACSPMEGVCGGLGALCSGGGCRSPLACGNATYCGGEGAPCWGDSGCMSGYCVNDICQ